MYRCCRQTVLVILLAACPCLQAGWVTDYAAVWERGYEYVDPRPESEYVAQETRLLVRLADGVPVDQLNLTDFIQVEGQQSGLHAGTTTVATEGRTIVFEPSEPFVANEAVDVILSPSFDPPQAIPVEPIQYRFYVLRPAEVSVSVSNKATVRTLAIENEPAAPIQLAAEPVVGAPMIMGNGVSVPSDFPHVTISTCRNPGDGYIFIEYTREPYYALILDNSGAPVWYRRGRGAEDFKVQKNGMITETQFIGYDQNFNRTKQFSATNGYGTDYHELQVLEDGGYLLLGLRTIDGVDMSQIVDGGYPRATVHETCVQEFTLADELIFQWRAWENVDIAGIGPEEVQNVRASSVHVSHLNAIDVDRDGHLLVSNRYLDEVTKIHRETGEVLWRLGGPQSDFIFVDDPLGGFSCQHDIRVVGPNRYTIFDNGNGHDPPVTRVVEYELDPNAMTATLVWQYRADPDRYAYYQGNAQRLSNGNTLINFVMPKYPKVTEVNREGEIEFEMDFLSGGASVYRVFRFPWTGVVAQPYLVVESHHDGVTLLFNKFGDPNTAYYRIYGGLDPQAQAVIATCDTTLLHLTELENGQRHYFRVTAVDHEGDESAFSNEESTLVHLYDPSEPGENMVRNGDFSLGQAEWTLVCGGSADAQWTTADGRALVTIDDEGLEDYHIRLIQDEMKLVQGETYVLAFDAGTDGTRLLEVKVNKKNVGSAWNYSKMGKVYLTTARQGMVMRHFTHAFTMESQTDLEGCLEVNLGGEAAAVYLDNVSLVRQAR